MPVVPAPFGDRARIQIGAVCKIPHMRAFQPIGVPDVPADLSGALHRMAPFDVVPLDLVPLDVALTDDQGIDFGGLERSLIAHIPVP